MADTTKTTKVVNVAEIVRYGDKIILPSNPVPMDKRAAAKFLMESAEQDEQIVDFARKYEGYEPHDVAAAFTRVVERRCGMVVSQTAVVDGLFGPMRIPPQIISFNIDVNESATIILGQFGLPNLKNGKITTHITMDRGANKPRYFMITAEIMQQDREWLNSLANDVELEVKENSVFRGKQFGYRLKDDEGDYLDIPKISFLDLTRVIQPIFPRDVDEQIETSVYTPIKRTAEWRNAGLSLKRGVLLYGPYGTGKTLTSYQVAKLARENGWTFIVCDRPDEFPEILRIARNYQPCVVFCEDIDAIASGRRTVELNEILNIMDGIESKNAEIMVVVTTNAYEEINKAMMRAGRLDARIHVPLPDAETCGRLIRHYAGNMISATEDISEACEILANNVTSSDVAEVVTQAKASMIAQGLDLTKNTLNSKAVKYAARVVREQAEASRVKPVENLSPAEKAALTMASAMESAARIQAGTTNS